MKRILLLLVIIFGMQTSFAQNPDYELLLANDTKTSDSEMEFDIIIHPKSLTTSFELASVQTIMTFNIGISSGTLTLSVVSGTSDLVSAQQPNSVQISGSELQVFPRIPPGAGNGSIINDYMRIARFKLTSSTPFTAATPDIAWKNSGSNPITKVNAYVNGTNTLITNPANHINDLSNSPLPIELTSFSAKQTGEKINLSWQTKTEVNNYGFDVERTSPLPSPCQGEGVPTGRDGRGWEKIGFVQGNGNSNSSKNYSFSDKASNGTFSYRLKQINTDGSYEYSESIALEVNAKPMKYDIANYPNPFNPETKIQFELPQASHVNLTIYNIVGEKVATLVNENMETGVYQKTFSSNSYYGQLTSGIYFYRLTTDNGVNITKKMVLAK